jgi:hypothetical protein
MPELMSLLTKYSHSFFLVKISKPSKFASAPAREGPRMENGEFSFDSEEKLKIGEKLEILVFPAVPESLS